MQNIIAINKVKLKIKKNTEIFALALLIFVTIASTTYYNYNKKKIYQNYKNKFNNVYLKKTIHHFLDNLEPRFKRVSHKVSAGETFDKILQNYFVDDKEISKIKNKLSNKINLNKLKAGQKIEFTVDQSKNEIKELIFQINNTEKIYLSKNITTNNFDQRKLITKLNKDIVYKENIILQSLYKSAVNENIPPNIIIEFARIYGFQVDFQRDIRKRDSFQIMYEIYTDDNKKFTIQEIFFC